METLQNSSVLHEACNLLSLESRLPNTNDSIVDSVILYFLCSKCWDFNIRDFDLPVKNHTVHFPLNTFYVKFQSNIKILSQKFLRDTIVFTLDTNVANIQGTYSFIPKIYECPVRFRYLVVLKVAALLSITQLSDHSLSNYFENIINKLSSNIQFIDETKIK